MYEIDDNEIGNEMDETENGKNKFKSWFKNKMKRIWAYRLSYLFIAPFLILFITYIVIPVLAAVGLGFTYFNSIEFPTRGGWVNYQTLFSQNTVLLKHVEHKTYKFFYFFELIVFIHTIFLGWFIAK